MIPLKKFIFFLALHIYCFVSAQDTSQLSVANTRPYRYAIRINPLRCAIREAAVGFEFGLNKNRSLEIRPGFIFPDKFLDGLYVGFASSPNMKYKGVSLMTETRFYTSSKENRQGYLSFLVGYRYMWYTDEWMWMGGLGGSSYANELYLSQWRNDLLLMVGKGSMRLNGPLLKEFELGAGFRLSYLHTKVNDCRFCHGSIVPPGSTVEETADKARGELRPSDGISGMLQVYMRYTIGMKW